jgi:voltage-gated potassium channel
MRPLDRLLMALAALAVLIGIGVFGYTEIEHWNLIDSLFMTVITLSTVGFDVVHPLSPYGKIFTTVLIFVGVGTVGYAIATVTEMILEGHVYKLLGIRKMDRKIAAMKNHVIVCGFGKLGSIVAAGLREEEIPFVLIEENPQISRDAIDKGFLVVEGNASDEEVLKKAGLERARSLLVTLSSKPADSVYITLSSRLGNPDLEIIAMASDPKTESKLVKAGANRVVSPFILGSHRMLLALTQPTLLDVIDIVISKEKSGFVFEELTIPLDSTVRGLTVEEFSRTCDIKFHIIAVQSKDGGALGLPTASTILNAGDKMVVIGEKNDINKVRLELGSPLSDVSKVNSFETH